MKKLKGNNLKSEHKTPSYSFSSPITKSPAQMRAIPIKNLMPIISPKKKTAHSVPNTRTTGLFDIAIERGIFLSTCCHNSAYTPRIKITPAKHRMYGKDIKSCLDANFEKIPEREYIKKATYISTKEDLFFIFNIQCITDYILGSFVQADVNTTDVFTDKTEHKHEHSSDEKKDTHQRTVTHR